MSRVPEVSPMEVHAAVGRGEGVLVDVREPWEYHEQHIAGSLLIPLAELPDRVGELPVDVPVYVHCRLGGRSARAVEYLREAGRPLAVNLLGGIDAWAECGFATEQTRAERLG